MFELYNLKDIKRTYAILNKIENDPKYINCKFPDEFWKQFKIEARKIYHRPCHDPLSVSIRNGWRTHIDGDGECGYDYTLIPDRGETDDEIKEIMYDSYVYRGRSNSPYDCTGRAFTRWWSSKRTPAGIVLIHAWSLDI